MLTKSYYCIIYANFLIRLLLLLLLLLLYAVPFFSLRDWRKVIAGYGLLIFLEIIDFLFVTD